jgi:AcrR family transcriptional regulator
MDAHAVKGAGTAVVNDSDDDVARALLAAPRLRRRRAEGRADVLKAAADAFTERGYAATTIDDIADRLGATKGLVYHYYRAKGDVFLDVHRTALTILLKRLEPLAAAATSPTQRLQSMAYEHARMMMTHHSFMRVAVQGVEMHLAERGRRSRPDASDVWKLRDRYEALFANVIAEGVASGEFRPVEPRLSAKLAFGALNWITLWYRPVPRRKSEIPRIAEEFATFVVCGMRRLDD